jgi:hypothetical protein
VDLLADHPEKLLGGGFVEAIEEDGREDPDGLLGGGREAEEKEMHRGRRIGPNKFPVILFCPKPRIVVVRTSEKKKLLELGWAADFRHREP